MISTSRTAGYSSTTGVLTEIEPSVYQGLKSSKWRPLYIWVMLLTKVS